MAASRMRLVPFGSTSPSRDSQGFGKAILSQGSDV
jgi:hypothetical protein